MNKVLTALRKLNYLSAFLPVLIFALVGAENVSAQKYQNTQNKVDQTLRSNARVNPSTLAMELSIPIADLPGRGGTSMPLVFNYSSKVWELRATGITFGPPNYPLEARPIYSDQAMAGWTSSYGIPRIYSTPDLYDCFGNGANDVLAPLPANCPQEYYYAKKIRVSFPGGSSHELRKDDLIYATTTSADTKTGTYYAVDGSRVRLEWGTGGIATLFLPDGGRYLFDSSETCYRYIDRHGNRLEYNSTTGSWTDTLGRTLTAPIPFTPQQIQDRTEGAQSFNMPGLGTASRAYQLVWKKLSTTGTLAEGYTLSYDASRCNPTVTRSPQFFESTHAFKACSARSGYFDPVVLTEIILPNEQKYKFSYNSHGEIARIDYPTGGYEKFVYEQVQGIGWEAGSYVADSYAQSNRGVTHRYVGAGDGAVEQHWEYGVGNVATGYGSSTYQVMTTNPDDSVEKRFLYVSLNRVSGSEYGNYGFDSALVGMEMETQSFDSAGALRSRNLFEWEVTTGTSPATNTVPQRDPRMKRQISVIFEPGSTSALAQMSETVYEVPGQPGVPTDEAYFAVLNAKQSKTYHYVPVSAATAADASLTTAVGWFSGSTPALITEKDYLYDTNYKTRNINGLVEETVIKNGTGVVKAKTQISYDQTNYLESPTTITNAPGWTDPGTTYRGLPTSVRSWTDAAVPTQYIETHTLYDQFGNVRKAWDGNGNFSEIQYTDNYTDSINRNGYALPTKTLSYSGANGTGTEFKTEIKYDFNTGLPVSTKDANGQTTTMSYADPLTGIVDPLLRIRNVTAPNGHQTRTEYGAGTSPSTRFVKSRTQIDANNWKEGYSWYDGLGRPVKSQSVASDGDVFVDTEYDQYGRPWKTTNPYRTGETIYKTENFYDTAGRVYKVRSPDGAEVETFFSLAATGDQKGTVVTVEDQANKQRRSITNGLGQLIRVDEPDVNNSNQLGAINAPNQATFYVYDPLSNLTTVKQGGTFELPVQTRSFVYDSLSRLKSATNPESGTINYSYDSNGNLATKTDARNIVTTYTYDALNRVTNRNYSAPTPSPQNYQPSPDVTYTYDDPAVANYKGKLTRVAATLNSIVTSETKYQAFDIMGRVTQSQQWVDGVSYGTTPMTYTYNLSGAMIEQRYPSGRVVKNVLDNDGDLSIVQSKKNQTAGYWDYARNFTFTAAGAVSSVQLGNGKWESTQFNSRLQPTQIALGTVQNGTDKLNLVYNYGTTNNNGNVLSQTITVPTETINNQSYAAFTATQTYTYDSLNRIKDAKEMIGANQQWKQTFDYDRFGNRRFNTTNNNTTTLAPGCPTAVCNPTIDPATNKLIGYTFDVSGNTKIDAENRQFIYDGENKQVEVKDSNNVSIGKYFYDGDGKRVKKISATETTIFVYNAGGQLVAEYATQIAQGTDAKVSYLTSDHLGSPRITTDANGQVVSRRDFQPFGEEIQRAGYGTDSVRQKFTSYERDTETDLDFAQARMYVKNHGRFTSADPLLSSGEIESPQTWNRFVYTLNNPLTFTDPTGLFAWSPELGGEASNDKLKQDKIAAEKAKNKDEARRLKDILNRRETITNALKEARSAAKSLNSKDRAKVESALNEYGEPGVANGVTVGIATGASADPSMRGGAFTKVEGSQIIVAFTEAQLSKENREGLFVSVAHEAIHVAGARNWLNAPSGSLISINNPSRFASEQGAYTVSSMIAQAANRPSVVDSATGVELWNKAWAVTDSQVIKARENAVLSQLAGLGLYDPKKKLSTTEGNRLAFPGKGVWK